MKTMKTIWINPMGIKIMPYVKTCFIWKGEKFVYRRDPDKTFTVSHYKTGLATAQGFYRLKDLKVYSLAKLESVFKTPGFLYVKVQKLRNTDNTIINY